MAKKNKLEHKICYELAEWLESEYPDLIFRFDASADLKLTIGQATVLSEKLRHKRGHPDLTIYEARGGYFGLIIELKTKESEVYKKDGTLARKWNKRTQSCRNEEQSAYLTRLISRGYKATYGFGIEGCKSIVSSYMKDFVTKQN